MMNKNIAIIWTIPIDVRRGGIHRIIAMLLTNLPLFGYKVDYLYSLDNYVTFINSKDNKRFNANELGKYIEKENYNLIIGQDAVFSSKLSEIIKSINHPNLKYINQYHNSIQLLEKVFSKSYFKGKIIKNKGFNKLVPLIKYLIFPIIKKRTIKNEIENFKINYNIADKLIFLSKYEKQLCELLIDRKLPKIQVINNPLTWKVFPYQINLSNKKNEVLIVSRLNNSEKRLDLALKIWNEINKKGIKDWKLSIVGDGIDKDSLIELCKTLNLKNVFFIGKKNPEFYYKEASIFMLTSVVEGWGLTLTEAQQSGVVPLAFDTYPALKDIITDGEDGFIIKEGDINDYINKLILLMENKELREQMAKNGLESCRRFDQDKIIRKWVDLIESL